MPFLAKTVPRRPILAPRVKKGFGWRIRYVRRAALLFANRDRTWTCPLRVRLKSESVPVNASLATPPAPPALDTPSPIVSPVLQELFFKTDLSVFKTVILDFTRSMDIVCLVRESQFLAWRASDRRLKIVRSAQRDGKSVRGDANSSIVAPDNFWMPSKVGYAPRAMLRVSLAKGLNLSIASVVLLQPTFIKANVLNNVQKVLMRIKGRIGAKNATQRARSVRRQEKLPTVRVVTTASCSSEAFVFPESAERAFIMTCERGFAPNAIHPV